MKRKIQLLVGIMISTSSIMAQTVPSQGSGNANSDFWSRSGNLPTTGGTGYLHDVSGFMGLV